MNHRHIQNHRASSTARLIARTMALLPRHPAYADQVDPLTARISAMLCHGCSPGRAGDTMLAVLGNRFMRRAFFAFERRFFPGLLVHFAHRKRHLRRIADESIARGYRQLVVLGAGLDTIALELGARHPELRGIEIDFPTTQAAKRRAIQKSGLESGGLAFAAVDLNKGDFLQDENPGLSALRGSPGFWDFLSCNPVRPDLPTVVVAEGLFMYLNAAEVRRILDRLSRYFTGDLRVLFTYLETDAEGRPCFVRRTGAGAFMDAVLKRMGEPFLWGIDDQRLPDFVAASGLECEALLRPSAENGIIGEGICVCSKN